MRTVTVICKECGTHFKLTRADRRYSLMRRWRRETGKMPVGHCVKCLDNVSIRRNENFRASGTVARMASENACDPRNFHPKSRVRPWAWRELDD